MNKSDTTSPFEHPRSRAEQGLQITVTGDRLIHLGDADRYRAWVMARTKSVGVSTLGQVGVNSNSTGAGREYSKAHYEPAELTQSQRAALAASAEVKRHAKSNVETLGDMRLDRFGISTDDQPQPQAPIDGRVHNFAGNVGQGGITEHSAPGAPTDVENVSGVSSEVVVPAIARTPNNPAEAQAAYAALEAIYGPAAPTAAELGTSVSDPGMEFESMDEPTEGFEYV